MNKRWMSILLLACGAALAGGCDSNEDGELHVEYGRQRGRWHGDSINGTAVIASMFSQAGHHVAAKSALSPTVEAADVIVWFPDDFDSPTVEVRRWLADWLSSGYNRTLVYVGRDYDAEPLYWEKAIARAPASQRAEMREQLDAAKIRVAAARTSKAIADAAKDNSANDNAAKDDTAKNNVVDADWFALTPAKNPVAAGELQGEWSAAVDAAKTEIELNDQLYVYGGDEPLLYTDDSVIAARVTRPQFGGGQLLLVQNGSFLLNLPLVNHEHRRLAAELIAAVEWQSGSECDVVFLESDEGGPKIHRQEPQAQPPTEADYPPPISDMLYHGIVLAIVVVLGSWPIFGRARRLAAPPLSDFGQHVESLGDLLRRSRDDGYCRERVALWQERERR